MGFKSAFKGLRACFFSADARMLELNCTFSVGDINYKKFDVLLGVVMNVVFCDNKASFILADK
jgi:hypothetical protein